MTTIAYRDGIMAADGRMTNNGWIVSDSGRKVWSAPNILVGVAGYPAGSQRLAETIVNSFAAHGRLAGIDAKAAEGVSAIVAAREAAGARVVLAVFEETGYLIINDPFHALGSGAPIALAAMHGGADAVLAVEVATKLDPFSGGVIETVRF